jgi:hypothetical protein
VVANQAVNILRRDGFRGLLLKEEWRKENIFREMVSSVDGSDCAGLGCVMAVIMLGSPAFQVAASACPRIGGPQL